MSKKYIIGIDGGSQSTKVVMYDLEGNVVCEGKGPLQPMHTPDADTAEHPDDDVWDSLCLAGKALMNAFTGDVNAIIGIGLGSIRCCRALLKADGTPAAPLISWQDARVTRPYEHTNPDVAWVTSFSGYLSHRLTGEFKDNIGNYFGQWPVDYKTWSWSEDDEVIKKFNIPRRMLFDVQMPGTVIGHITEQAALATHFPVGLPVICTTSDKPVEALGAGLLDDDTAVISLGTYIALMMSGKALPKDPVAWWPIMSSIPETLLYEGYGIRKGMWTVSWLRDMLGESLIQDAKAQGISPEDLLNQKASVVPPGCNGLMTVLDWLTNPWEPYKRGIMIVIDVRELTQVFGFDVCFCVVNGTGAALHSNHFTVEIFRAFHVVIVCFHHHQQAAFVVAVGEIDRFFTRVSNGDASQRQVYVFGLQCRNDTAEIHRLQGVVQFQLFSDSCPQIHVKTNVLVALFELERYECGVGGNDQFFISSLRRNRESQGQCSQ
jgi:sugar (pentulose or hexulose) kinase